MKSIQQNWGLSDSELKSILKKDPSGYDKETCQVQINVKLILLMFYFYFVYLYKNKEIKKQAIYNIKHKPLVLTLIKTILTITLNNTYYSNLIASNIFIFLIYKAGINKKHKSTLISKADINNKCI